MLRLYNSLTRKIEDVRSIHPPHVGMYTCGPTVYDYTHIGNFRTYTTADFLFRTLEYNKFRVKHVMNITDVGHLTGDNLGDADIGEDRIEQSAKTQGKNAADIAKFYTKAFIEDFKKLNLLAPYRFVRATDHIEEQVSLVKRLEGKGFTYKTSDGVYFDTEKFPAYGKLSSLDQIKVGVRVKPNPEKRNPRDFALWKFTPKGVRRQMEWEGLWAPPGVVGKVMGFPGWHLECSAMSMEYLGESFDIHVGGVDLRETHHPNEIAQSEAATGKPFVKYWVHGAFVLVDGERMSKSKGNNYTVSDVVKKEFDPLSLRYIYMQTHYRQEMNFTFEALEGAQHALRRLYEQIEGWGKGEIGCAQFEQQFLDAVNDDLNMPKAVSVMWELLKSRYPSRAKAASLARMDEVLGLGLSAVMETKKEEEPIPSSVLELVEKREALRRQRRFHLADELRHKIKKMGYHIEDKKGTTEVKKN